MQQSFMKTRPILPLVLSMSLPMVLSMMVSSLYNIVDSYYVAKISEDAMTALSLVYPVQNLINAVTIGFTTWARRSRRRPAPPPPRASCGTPCTGWR